MTKLFISNGNAKLKCNIFDIPAIKTCKSCMECHKYCYARKAEKIYPAVLPCRQRNLDATKQSNFKTEMISLLGKKRSNIVRLHSSGDFYSNDYIKNWFTIMESLPDKKFYAYTKRDDLFTAKILSKKPSNLTLIFSLDGIQQKTTSKVPKGFDKVALVSATKSNCPAQLDKKVKCGVDCLKCIDKKSAKIIIFKKH